MNTFWRWTVVMFTQQCSPEFTVYLPWHLRFAQQRAGEWVGGCFNYSARSWGELSSHCSGLEKVQALHAHVQGSFQPILGGGVSKSPEYPEPRSSLTFKSRSFILWWFFHLLIYLFPFSTGASFADVSTESVSSRKEVIFCF